MDKDWNSAYAVADTPWDKGSAAPPLAEYLKAHRIEGSVLVPGCGSGHDAQVLLNQGAQVKGIDIAPLAVEKAHALYPALSRHVFEGDFLKTPTTENGSYDWIVEHTCLCAIDPSKRKEYATTTHRLLRRGGRFFAIFFREVSHDREDHPPYPINEAEIETLFGERFELLESYTPKMTYPERPQGAEEVRVYRKL